MGGVGGGNFHRGQFSGGQISGEVIFTGGDFIREEYS